MLDFPDVLKGMAYATSAVGIVSNAVLGYAFFFKYPYIKAMQDSGQGLHRVVLDIDKADLYDRGKQQRAAYVSRPERAYSQQVQQPRRRVKTQKAERARTRKEKRQMAAAQENAAQQYDYDAVRAVSQRYTAPQAAAPVQAAVPTPQPQAQESARVVREPQQPENGEVRSRSLRKVADQ